LLLLLLTLLGHKLYISGQDSQQLKTLILHATAASNHTASITRQHAALFVFAAQNFLGAVFSTTAAPDQACHRQLPTTTSSSSSFSFIKVDKHARELIIGQNINK